MWSDELNKKIQEGESRNLPNYSDKAWEDMESLLDRHLPQKKKRRRLILWLLPLLLGSGLITYLWMGKTGSSKPVAEQDRAQALPTRPVSSETLDDSPQSFSPGSTTNAEPGPGATSDKKYFNEADPVRIKNVSADLPASDKKASGNLKKEKISTKRRQVFLEGKNMPSERTLTARSNTPVNDPELHEKDINDRKITGAVDLPSAMPLAKTDVAGNSPLASPDIEKAKEKKVDSSHVENKQPKKTAPASKPSFADKLTFQVSFGPDISSVGLKRPGRVQFQYGIGLAYAINQNFTVRTGFFAGDKKYSADPTNYKTPYPIQNLEKIDADCYVYEIPVGLLYNINPTGRHNWLVGASASTYLMKRETYGYHYKNNWGQPQYYKRSYRNENSHLFSVLTISGGYKHNFNDRLSVFAEPYFKFPVSGIGVGKVKLNNTGILFSIGYKPFRKK